ncbi:MAG: xylulokinase [Lactovum sp.]
MKKEEIILSLKNNQTFLGIELGSTRIKSVLIGSDFKTIATGSYEWENKLENGFWTYSLEDVWTGLQMSYRQLKEELQEKYSFLLESVGSIGFSAMMHGYMVFDKSDELLVPFRTWRNATTSEAAEKLTQLFQYNIPERWSIAHLYQAMLDQEEHISQISYLTTLAGYVHWQLTGEKSLGIGDASGMFPIDIESKHYDKEMLRLFKKEMGNSISLENILPKVLLAGENAGNLTEFGAKLLDPIGDLKAGIPLCPAEGDAGTGMIATNSIDPRTGNISVGTSAFAMLVMDKKLKNVYPEIDLVTTPLGDLVAMVHVNNCSSDINAWIKIFEEYTQALGIEKDRGEIFSLLFEKALEADKDSGNLLSYGYLSGENITKISEGRPLFVRQANSNFNLANFMYVHIATAFAAVRIGMDILKKENVEIESLIGHGGLFTTPEVGQKILSSALEIPITVMDTASEGGAWGMAVLAAFQVSGESNLQDFLKKKVFNEIRTLTIHATQEEMEGYALFAQRYVNGLEIESKAVEVWKEE